MSEATISFGNHPIVKYTALAGLFVFGLGGFAAIMAYLYEDSPQSLWLLVIFLPLFLASLVAFVSGSVAVHLTPTALIISRFGRQTQIPYQTITEVKLGQWIRLKTPQRSYRLWYPLMDTMGHLCVALETRIAPYKPEHPVRLPIVFRKQATLSTIMLVMGFVMLTAAVMGFFGVFSDRLNGDRIDLMVVILSSLMLGLGLWLCTHYFFWQVHRYVFTQSEIKVQRRLGAKYYPVAAIESLALTSVERTYRGVSKAVPVLMVYFKQGSQLQIEIGLDNGYPFDYSPVYARKALHDLLVVLEGLYVS